MSTHLENIIKKQDGISNLQVVFIDIEKYSKRRTKIQSAVIYKFIQCVKETLTEISQHYIEYTQNNDINLKEDTITLSTGDGALVVFTFDGLSEIHLEYSKILLRKISEINEGYNCSKLIEDGYCNDHPHFNVRIGISEGNGLIFHDFNNHYNVVGDTVNMASRVMNLADRNQIVCTAQARDQIIDIAYRQGLDSNFIRYPQVRVKHDVVIDAYQYIDDLTYINSSPLKIGKLAETESAERELLEQYHSITRAGFKKLYPNRQEFFNELFSNILRSVKSEVKIMGICVSLFRESDKPLRGIEWNSGRATNLLIDLALHECNIKILFLKRYLSNEERKYYALGPQGDFYFMRERDEDVEYDFRRGKRLKIISNIAVGKFLTVLIELARKTQGLDINHRKKILNCLQLREYIGLPAISLYIADNDIYMTPYLYKRHCSTVPAFQFGDTNSDLFKDYNAHFDAAWKGSETTSIIHNLFLDRLINDPINTLELYDRKYIEVNDQELSRLRKNPKHLENPEHYRIEEKVISEVLKTQ